ncbi:di-trans,poly-cis-decaprenylcistransferase [Wolbachia pipientis]|uniref:Isoprenyl transferase n=1 Tax=Wolbachia pipientis TaxID=955 RepID=A0A1E7QJW7_WOLPI|nr:polyprenyl diphosphate synthase [Wolbachia pipientis]OEY86761.1 di-trans,poly-cis-decaprenylcistransferase [Wolbachia pipientis]
MSYLLKKKTYCNIDNTCLPKHVAIIMDGNGRWASKQRKTKINGYKKGSKVAFSIIECCVKLAIPYLTLYAFSMENWQRPQSETNELFNLLYSFLTDKNQISSMCDLNIKLNFIGNINLLPHSVIQEIKKVEELTSINNGLLLTIAVSYGAKQEIINAISVIIQNNINDISENEFEKFLYTKDLPQLDLLIRTGGEKRLSNFLLWQAAYAELYFCNTLWPNFSCKHLIKALQEYTVRERKYGR